MTLLKIDLGLTGITVIGMAVSVIHQNLTITPAFESDGKEIPSLPTPSMSKDTQPQKVTGTRQPKKPVCNEIKQMVTDASINASNLSMKDLIKISIYGNSLLN